MHNIWLSSFFFLIYFSWFLGQYDDDSSPGSDNVGIDWTKPMDQFLIELMSEQVFEGNKIDTTLNTQAWVHVMKSFNKKFGLHYDEYVMGNRYRSLMKQYRDIRSILNQNGFVWDEFQQMIVAEDDVWEAYIEVRFLLEYNFILGEGGSPYHYFLADSLSIHFPLRARLF